MRSAGGINNINTPAPFTVLLCSPAAAEQRAEAQEKVGHPFTVTPNKQILYDVDTGADGAHSIRRHKVLQTR